MTLYRPFRRCVPILAAHTLSLVGAGCRVHAEATVHNPEATAHAPQGTGDSVTPLPVRIRDSLFTLALAEATVRYLDSLPRGADQWVRPRLYEIPVEGTCVSEEHVICGFYYLLGVAPNREGLSGAFNLGWLGQITHIEWLPRSTKDIDFGRLRLTVTNYPSWVFKSEPSIRKIQKRFEVQVSVDTMIVKQIP